MDLNDFHDEHYLRLLFDLQVDETTFAGGRNLTSVKEHIRWLYSTIVDSNPNKRLLDLGCGIGHYTREFAKLGYEAIGVDISPLCIDYAKSISPSNLDCHYLCADFTGHELPRNNGTIIYSNSTFNLLPREIARKLLERVYEALAPAGIFYIEVLHPHQILEDSVNVKAHPFHNLGFGFNRPVIVLSDKMENIASQTIYERQFWINKETYEVTTNDVIVYCYSSEEYTTLLANVGFRNVTQWPGKPPKLSDLEFGPYTIFTGTK